MTVTMKTGEVASSPSKLRCDYLVVGAGTSGMSFIDTLLTEDPQATVILVDRNSQPGGHWTQAYPFVRLHQSSFNYGVNSLPLGKTTDKQGRESFDRDDRATGAEIVAYYNRVLQQFLQTGRVTSFFDADYQQQQDGKDIVTLTTTGAAYEVECRKVVTASTNVVVPSMRDPLIPVHECVSFIPINNLHEKAEQGRNKYQNYVVIGAGKTGIDAILELLEMGIPQHCITWIISRDVWLVLRDGLYGPAKNFWKDSVRLLGALVEGDSPDGTMLALEKRGILGRLQPNGPLPQLFKGPTIDTTELPKLRSVENTVRLGRVVSIEKGQFVMENGNLPFDVDRTLVIDCMVDRIYGFVDTPDDFKFFEDKKINLGPWLAVFNPSFTPALIAYLEATFEKDETKNSFCCPVVGKYSPELNPKLLLGFFYAENKQIDVLMNYPPAIHFLLSSRTSLTAPHHHGGLLKLLWAAIGPLGAAKLKSRFVKKVESGGFDGIDDTFGVRRSTKLSRKDIKASLRKKSALRNYPPSNENAVSSTKLLCCQGTAAVVPSVLEQ